MTYFILSFCKTGRWWRVTSRGDGMRKARAFGLKDFEIERES
jgi:hypothetical protein